MKSLIMKRSINIGGHRSSVSLEEEFWQALRDIAARRNKTLSHLVGEIDRGRKTSNLSSSIRLFVLEHFRAAAELAKAVAIPHRTESPALAPVRSEAPVPAFNGADQRA